MPRPLHELHPEHLHTSSSRDVPGGLQMWTLYFSAPVSQEKNIHIGCSLPLGMVVPKAGRDVTHWAGVVDMVTDAAHPDTVP